MNKPRLILVPSICIHNHEAVNKAILMKRPFTLLNAAFTPIKRVNHTGEETFELPLKWANDWITARESGVSRC